MYNIDGIPNNLFKVVDFLKGLYDWAFQILLLVLFATWTWKWIIDIKHAYDDVWAIWRIKINFFHPVE